MIGVPNRKTIIYKCIASNGVVAGRFEGNAAIPVVADIVASNGVVAGIPKDDAERITYTYDGSTYTNYLGNYWDNYTNTDANNDGIWDNPYPIDSDRDYQPLVMHWKNYIKHLKEMIFDTCLPTNPYPSIMGTHEGKIIPSCDITVSTLYTYPCAGTGGHTVSIELYDENNTLIANGTWNGYIGDYHNITIENETGASYVMLLKNHKYNYTIVTGSYPQIIHATSKEVTGGTISCSSFVDVNGKVYYDWIPAIRLE